jgi:hypothetical protein
MSEEGVGSGLPVPRRRTFADAIVASAHCMSAALRHPGFACFHSPALGHGQPLAEFEPGRVGFRAVVVKAQRLEAWDAFNVGP